MVNKVQLFDQLFLCTRQQCNLDGKQNYPVQLTIRARQSSILSTTLLLHRKKIEGVVVENWTPVEKI